MSIQKVKTKEISFDIRKAVNGDFYVVIIKNYRCIWRTSETYRNKADACKAIEIAQKTTKKTKVN